MTETPKVSRKDRERRVGDALLCPFCDERSGEWGTPIVRPHKVLHLRTCVMGHQFYTIEEVPKNYKIVEEELEKSFRQAIAEEKQAERLQEKKEERWAKSNRKAALKYQKRRWKEEKANSVGQKNLKAKKKDLEKEREQEDEWYYKVRKKAGQKESYVIRCSQRPRIRLGSNNMHIYNNIIEKSFSHIEDESTS